MGPGLGNWRISCKAPCVGGEGRRGEWGDNLREAGKGTTACQFYPVFTWLLSQRNFYILLKWLRLRAKEKPSDRSPICDWKWHGERRWRRHQWVRTFYLQIMQRNYPTAPPLPQCSLEKWNSQGAKFLSRLWKLKMAFNCNHVQLES